MWYLLRIQQYPVNTTYNTLNTLSQEPDHPENRVSKNAKLGSQNEVCWVKIFQNFCYLIYGWPLIPVFVGHFDELGCFFSNLSRSGNNHSNWLTYSMTNNLFIQWFQTWDAQAPLSQSQNCLSTPCHPPFAQYCTYAQSLDLCKSNW